MVVFLTLVICAIVLAVYIFAAKEFSSIAADKGYTDSKYFWWCFWLPPVGYLMVIALPDRGKTVCAVSAKPEFDNDALPEL